MDERTIDGLLWGVGTVLLAGLLFFSLGPDRPPATMRWASDGLLHGTGYAAVLICFLFAGVWRPGRGAGPLAGKGPLIATAAVGFSAVVELLQSLVSRTPQLSDIAANAVGALLALSLVEVLRLATDS